MLFSVILPVYNVEKYLNECVDSILKQTFNDYELILVDDGSTDNSSKICDELAEKYACIKVLHKKNGGLSDARNAGTRIANGKYIVYVDSDDFILSELFLEKLAEKTSLNPDLIFYKFVKYHEKTAKLDECAFSYASAEKEDYYASKIKRLVEADAFYGMAWIKAIKRSVILDNNIEFEVGLLGEDMEWNYHIITHSCSMELIDEAFVAYRQREGSITSTHKLKNLTDFIYILEKWSDNIQSNCQDAELKNALLGSLAKYYSNLFVVYARLSDKNKKEYKNRMKELDRLWEYSYSSRPKTIAKIYRMVGFELTVFALRILDRIK